MSTEIVVRAGESFAARALLLSTRLGDAVEGQYERFEDKLDGVRDNVDKVRQELEVKLGGRIDDANNRITTTGAEHTRELSALGSKVDLVGSKVDDVRKELDDKLGSRIDEVGRNVTATRMELDGHIDRARGAVEEKVDTLRTGLDQKIDATRERLEQRIDAFRTELDQKIDTKVDKLRAEFYERIGAIRAELNGKIDGASGALSELRKDMDGLKESIASLRVWTMRLCYGVAVSLLGVIAHALKWL